MKSMTAGARRAPIGMAALAAACILALLLAGLLATGEAGAAGPSRASDARVARVLVKLRKQRRHVARVCAVRRGRQCRRARNRLERLQRLARASRVKPGDRKAAPVLSVDGTTLRWNRVADVSRYVLATKVPGGVTTYSTVTGLSVTPAAVPGATVTYGLRTDVAGSAWAKEVSIAYAAATAAPAPTPAPAPTASPTPTPTPTPTATPSPAPTPAPAPSANEWLGGVATWYGFNSTTEPDRWKRLHAQLVRFDAAPSGSKAITDAQLRTKISLALGRGVRPYPILYWDSGASSTTGYTGRMPSDADLDRFVAWMKEHEASVPEWELGNEVGFDYMKTADTMADDYARTAMALCRKLAAAGVTARIVLNADLTGNGQFIAQMAAAEPELADRPEVAAFSIHPYGPQGPSGYNDAVGVEGMPFPNFGWQPYIEETIRRIDATAWRTTVGQGTGQKPLHVTEWGISATETASGSGVGVDHMWNAGVISDGGWARPMNFAGKGVALYDNVRRMYDRYGPAGTVRPGAISRFVLYKDVNNWAIAQRDDSGRAAREQFFGLLQQDGSALPGVTEKAQLALDLR